MPLSDSIATAAATSVCALLGSAMGALLSFRASNRNYELEMSKLILSNMQSQELTKARVEAYKVLWQCLGGISTYTPEEIARNLEAVQKELQNWYYGSGGGLLLNGSAAEGGSTKAAFFQARDLRSKDVAKIWEAFHNLRRCLRRDLGIYESSAEEAAALQNVKQKLREYAK